MGWNKDLKLGYRVRADDPQKFEEPSFPLEVPEGAKPEDRMVAKWPDDMEWIVESISVQEWQSTTGRRGKVDRLWEGVRASTHHDLHLAQRPDRNLLLDL